MESSWMSVILCLSTVFLSQDVIRAIDMECCSIKTCRCSFISDFELLANCSNLGLKVYPIFSQNVVEVDLSHNSIVTLETDEYLPARLIFLDISYNNISKLSNTSFKGLPYLRYLNIEGNKISPDKNAYESGMFKYMRYLRILNLKNNVDNETKMIDYPNKAFIDLTTLEVLEIDGLYNSGFGPVFYNLTKLNRIDLSGLTGKCYIPIIISDYFLNLRFLQHIDLSYCHILRIESGSFRSLPLLEILDISNNIDLTFRVLSNLTYDLQFTSIRILKVNKIHKTFGVGTQLFIEDVKYIKNTSLEEFHCDYNRLESAEKDIFTYIPESVYLMSIVGNRLCIDLYVLYTWQLKDLKVLYADLQYFSQTGHIRDLVLQLNPDSCDVQVRHPCEQIVKSEQSTAIYTDVSKYTESKMQLIVIFIPIPPNLERISIRESHFKHKIPPLVLKSNVLNYVDLSGNLLYDWEGPILHVDTWNYLDLSNNFCSKVSRDFFYYFGNLSTLLINDNILGPSLSKDINGSIFRSLTKLKRLDLSENKIHFLPRKIFGKLRALRTLNLNNNLLTRWNLNIGHMNSLKHICLSNNEISFITIATRNAIDDLNQKSNISIDLRGNPMMCDCKHLDYLKWLLQRKSIFIGFDSFVCEFSNMSFRDLDSTISQLDLQCASKLGLIIGVSMSISIFMIVVFFGIIYRYRWKLRYIYYMAKTRYQGYSSVSNSENDIQYEYDAFISYADEDKSFVVSDMRRHLENESNFNLCIHHRDFIPGIEIAENITNAIHKSRVTIVVLSHNFLNSYWCNYEFNMARMESIYARAGKNVLFLIFYGNISTREIPMSMMELIESESYIEYPNDEYGNVVFWQKIKDTLNRRR